MNVTTKRNMSQRRDFGILLMRAGLGIMFILHGYPIILGGPPAWERLGSAMTLIGIDMFPIAWGLLAGLAETLGGTMLIFGLFTHYACFALTFTMVMATAFHLNKGDTFNDFSHPLELATVMLAMIIIGAGRYSIDYWLFGDRQSVDTQMVSRTIDDFVMS